MSAALVDLVGGANKYPWATEEGMFTAELDLKFGEYPDFVFTLFLGLAPTATTTETTGGVTTLTNFKGTSLKVASTGVSSIAIKSGSEADLKFGKYVVVAASATTVDVYFSSDADMGRGTNGVYTTDTLKILAGATITTLGVLTTITGFGLDLVGGSGTIGMTTGDSATFYVRPPHTGATSVIVGGLSDQTFPEFGAIVMGQKRGNQELVELECYRCKAAGMPINFNSNTFSESDVKIKLLYDSAIDGVYKVRTIKPSGT